MGVPLPVSDPFTHSQGEPHKKGGKLHKSSRVIDLLAKSVEAESPI